MSYENIEFTKIVIKSSFDKMKTIIKKTKKKKQIECAAVRNGIESKSALDIKILWHDYLEPVGTRSHNLNYFQLLDNRNGTAITLG